MSEHINSVVVMLRALVNGNLDLLRANEKAIREIMNLPISDDRSTSLSQHYKYSRSLLAENSDYLRLQTELIQFLSKYRKVLDNKQQSETTSEPIKQVQPKKHNAISEPVNVEEPKVMPSRVDVPEMLTSEKVFELTVNGQMEFSQSHPYFYDNEFAKGLLDYYTQVENYEMCARIVEQKGRL